MDKAGYIKHKALIELWADGAEIEYLSQVDGAWKPACDMPVWSAKYEYRVKPKPLEVFCNVYPDYVRCYTTKSAAEFHATRVRAKAIAVPMVEKN